MMEKMQGALEFNSEEFEKVVGDVGFEPTTLWSQTRCTTGLC